MSTLAGGDGDAPSAANKKPRGRVGEGATRANNKDGKITQPPQCPHLKDFMATRGINIFIPLARCCFATSFPGNAKIDVTLACLGCARLCSREEAVLHMKSQAAAVGHNAHCTYADIERAELFCAACGTYVYSPEFDSTVLGVRAMATGVTPSTAAAASAAASAAARGPGGEGEGGFGSGGGNPAAAGAAKKRKSLVIEPSHAKVTAAGGHPLANINSHGVPRGLRGIANLGNTCFLATVLQAMAGDKGSPTWGRLIAT